MWEPQDIHEHIPVLDFTKVGGAMAGPVQTYNQYYGLNIEMQIEGVEHYVGSFEAAGFKLVAHVYKLEQAHGTVYFQHGYLDHVGLFSHLIRHCLNQGLNVFAYDLPGHGLSTGDQAGIESFEQYDAAFSAGLNLVQQFMPGPIVALGQSTGSAVIINYILKRGLTRHTSPFARVHLLAPLVRPVDWWRTRLLYYVARFFIKTVPRGTSQNSSDPVFLKFVQQHDALQSTVMKVSWVGALHKWLGFIENCASVDMAIHIVQGTNDGTVDYRHNLEVLENKFSECQVQFIEHGRHHLANEQSEKRQQVFSALTPLL